MIIRHLESGADTSPWEEKQLALELMQSKDEIAGLRKDIEEFLEGTPANWDPIPSVCFSLKR